MLNDKKTYKYKFTYLIEIKCNTSTHTTKSNFSELFFRWFYKVLYNDEY